MNANAGLSLKSNDLNLPAALREALRSAFLAQAEQFLTQSRETYPEVSGHPEFREVLGAITPHWAGDVLVTNSATEALYLALAQVRRSGGTALAVQTPCYFAVLRQAAELNLKVVAWEHVADLEQLEFDGVLLTSNFTPPAGQSMSSSEKARLAELADARGAWIIEDNPYDPLWFKSQPAAVPSAADRTIRIGSLSKMVSPRFRLGFLRAEAPIFNALRSHKITLNLSTAPDLQAICAKALSLNSVSTLRADLYARMLSLRNAIAPQVKPWALQITEPQGGSYLCLPVPQGVDVRDLVQTCATQGLALDLNDHYYPDAKVRPYVRLHYGAIALEDTAAAAQVLGAALRSVAQAERLPC
jgi:DNA-binding transcriptional MocR family regulator